nr:hypothetical protein [Tanacetum cinerariifolium]
MLNKENYVPWSSHLLRYAKSRPNGKLIHNSIINGPYVRRMIPEPGDTNKEVLVNETFLVQTDDELTKKELNQIEADDQAIQTMLLGLPEDIYVAVYSCETAQEIWLRVQQMMKGTNIGIQEKKAKLFNERESRHVTIVHQTKDLHTADYTQLYDFLKYNQKEVDELEAERLAKIQDPLALMANFNNTYVFPAPHQDQPSFKQNYMQQPIPNPEDITDPITAMNMALTLMAKTFKLNYSTPTNNNHRISSNPRNRQIAQPGMNMGQDRKMQMIGGNGGNQFRQYAGQNARNLTRYNDVQNIRNQIIQNAIQNLRVQNIGNQNGSIGVLGNGNQNQIGNGNLVAARAEGNAAGQNGNQIRCYNCRGVANLDEIEEVNAKCILMANPPHTSTSGTQTDKAPVYDSDGSAEVHDYENCDDNEIFNKFTREEQYTELLEPIPKQHQVLQNDNNVISEFLKEAAKFVGDFKSLTKEADKSLAKYKALELEIERFLRSVVSQDIMFVVQKTSVVDTSNLQTDLERTKERFENCIIKKENEYAKLWNDWYKKCDECKYEKISYDKAYKDMQQKIERLQAQFGDLKELEFQVLNYARENAHLKATYKNLFDSISVSRTQTKTIIASLQNKLQNTIYKNAKLRTQLFKKVSDQKDNTHDTSANTKFAKQSIVENLPKVGETHAFSKPVTSNSVSTPQESKGVNNDKVEKHVPNIVRASTKIKPITVSQPPVFTKKDVYSDSNGLSSTGVDNTKTRRPQPRSNTKNDRVPSASKSS